MRFNQLLQIEGIDPTDVTVLAHNTNAQPFRRLLPSILFEQPKVFDAYQSLHSDQASRTLRGRRFMASFVPITTVRVIFAGLYEVHWLGEKPRAEIYRNPLLRRIAYDFGDPVTARAIEDVGEGTQAVFDMRLIETLGDLRGRLQIATPQGRTYARLAENLDAEVIAISEEVISATPVPDWDAFVVTADDVRQLPLPWQARLREWRGIYLILDKTDGARYVGAAYGAENLLGRWLAHVAGPRGITVELAQRDPSDFRFSILELLSPAARAEEVLALEAKWKERLHTRVFGLNKN